MNRPWVFSDTVNVSLNLILFSVQKNFSFSCAISYHRIAKGKGSQFEQMNYSILLNIQYGVWVCEYCVHLSLRFRAKNTFLICCTITNSPDLWDHLGYVCLQSEKLNTEKQNSLFTRRIFGANTWDLLPLSVQLNQDSVGFYQVKFGNVYSYLAT